MAKVPFSQRVRDSKAIMRRSLQIMSRERDLWVFPVLAFLVGMPMLLLLVGVIAFGFSDLDAVASWLAPNAFWMPLVFPLAIMVLFYPVSWISAVLMSAMAFGVHERLAGRPCSLGDAWRRAWSRKGTIARFTLLATVVGGLLAVLGAALDKVRIVPYVGRIVQMVGAFAWAAATFFVVPIIVVEGERRATDAIKGSVDIARQQWGKSVAGMVTIALALMIPMAAVMLIMMGLFFIVMFSFGGMVLPIVAGIALGVMALAVMAVSFVAQSAQVVYQTALFRFARTGRIDAGFDEATLVDVWKPYQQ